MERRTRGTGTEPQLFELRSNRCPPRPATVPTGRSSNGASRTGNGCASKDSSGKGNSDACPSEAGSVPGLSEPLRRGRPRSDEHHLDPRGGLRSRVPGRIPLPHGAMH